MATKTYAASERLKSRTIIDRLFKEGQSFSIYPLRVVWVAVSKPSGAYPAQFALSVPKRAFKKAVDRNRLRRRIREAYRLNKGHFYHQLCQDSAQDTQYALMIIYTAKKTLPFQEIEAAMVKLLHRFVKRVEA